jgi:hypothetical protein
MLATSYVSYNMVDYEASITARHVATSHGVITYCGLTLESRVYNVVVDVAGMIY